MKDMLSASYVCRRWRELALETASLWWDASNVHSTDDYSIRRFVTILQRGKNARVHIAAAGASRFAGVGKPRITAAIRDASPRLGSLLISPDAYKPCIPRNHCTLAEIPLFSAAHRLCVFEEARLPYSGQTVCLGQHSRPQPSIHFPSLPAPKSVIIEFRLPTCPMRFQTVEILEHIRWDEQWTSDMLIYSKLLFKLFPNVRTLKLQSRLQFWSLGQKEVLTSLRKLDAFANLDRLTLASDMSGDPLGGILYILDFPIREIQLEPLRVSNGFAHQVRGALRSLLPGPWTISLAHKSVHRNAAQGNDDKLMEKIYQVAVHSFQGRVRGVSFKTYREALESLARPMIQNANTRVVRIDGLFAAAVFYASCKGSDMSHLQTLHIVVSTTESLCVPRVLVSLPCLHDIMLDPVVGGATFVEAGRLNEVFAMMRFEKRPEMRVRGVYVYGRPGELDIYVRLTEGSLRCRGWAQVIS